MPGRYFPEVPHKILDPDEASSVRVKKTVKIRVPGHDWMTSLGFVSDGRYWWIRSGQS